MPIVSLSPSLSAVTPVSWLLKSDTTLSIRSSRSPTSNSSIVVVLVLRFKKRVPDAGAFLGDLLGLQVEADVIEALYASFGICDGVIGSIVGGIGWGLCDDKDILPIAVEIEISLFWATLGLVGDRDSSNERSFMVVDKEKDLEDPDGARELAHSEHD